VLRSVAQVVRSSSSLTRLTNETGSVAPRLVLLASSSIPATCSTSTERASGDPARVTRRRLALRDHPAHPAGPGKTRTPVHRVHPVERVPRVHKAHLGPRAIRGRLVRRVHPDHKANEGSGAIVDPKVVRQDRQAHRDRRDRRDR